MIRALRTRYRVAGLTNNMPVGHGSAMARTPDLAAQIAEVMALFAHVIESWKIGARKPEPRFYARACEVVGVPAQVDPENAKSNPQLQQSSQSMRFLIGPVRLLRLDPDGMRKPANLIPQGHPLEFGLRGEGLAAVYDALLSRRLSVFLDISKRFTELFPTARAIQLTNPDHATKALGVELNDGQSIGADRLSEGMLYWLAFAALPYLQPTPLILIEEPENGLHPSRIGDVMHVLREVSKTAQIILATHHPLVINELQSDEVTIITRTPERGTIATPLSRTKNFEQRSKVYALGELWLNYADGEFESDLVADSTIPSAAGSHAGPGLDRGRRKQRAGSRRWLRGPGSRGDRGIAHLDRCAGEAARDRGSVGGGR